VPQSAVQHRAGELADQARLLSDGDELVRWYRTELRVPPARKRFSTHYNAIARPAQGLEHRDDVCSCQGVLQVAGQPEPAADPLGHEAGDAVLVLAAQRLRASAPADALTARIGGDELLVVLLHGGPSAEQVLQAVGGTVEVAGTQFALRVRGGFSPVEGEFHSFERLLRHAQAALAKAAAGGTRFRAWSLDLAVDPRLASSWCWPRRRAYVRYAARSTPVTAATRR
jgi:GGDEF domain-containing protein